LLMLLGLALHVAAGPARSQRLEEKLWAMGGGAYSIVRAGGTFYVTCGFQLVGPNMGGGVPVDKLSGLPLQPYPRVTGVVNTVVSDGVGGWYVGGWFVAVGGLPRRNLAHILPDGSVSAWSPDPDAEVLALNRNGQTLYVGGRFATIEGRHRAYIAAIDLDGGDVTDWDPAANLQVRAFLVGDSCVYVGGDFTNIGGKACRGLAALDPITGAATSWNPDLGGSIRALALVGDTVYVGGDFYDLTRCCLAAVSASTGQVSAWNPGVAGPGDFDFGDPTVYALAERDNRLYLAGHFTGAGGQVRGGLAQIDLSTGQTTSWNPDPGPWGPWNRDVTALALADTTMYVAGLFEEMGNWSRNYVAEVGLAGGQATPWDPNANFLTNALAVGREGVYVAGQFTSIGPDVTPRFDLAAFDVTTGAAKDWGPMFDGLDAMVLTATHGRVYVSGYFDFIGGKARYMFAALDTLTGAATEWDPRADNLIYCAVPMGDTLYIAGRFTSLCGQTRHRVASIDLNTQQLTDWAPDVNDEVYGLAVKDSTVYLVGYFRSVGGVPRHNAAAVNARTGAVEEWNPQPDGIPAVVAVVDSTAYVGGEFGTIGGQACRNLAALDARTGLATDWVADVNSDVISLLTWGDTLFVGGTFSLFGGQNRQGLVALDRRTGALLPWDPGFSQMEWNHEPWSAVSCLIRDGSSLYVAGGFYRSGFAPLDGLAAFNFAPQPPPPDTIPTRLAFAPFAPNPVHSTATIRFALPAEAPVDLEVFDVQGRRVAVLLDHAVRPAGPNVVSLNALGWRLGFYFCRLRAGGASATRKFVVLR
jgi:trimeric autotransporter adhesin